ncbi:MAG: putative 4-hydroxybenzoate polyprenyltransferase [Proteobacteria bacterium]|nr:putative 4-hydroxybenzoate polyprenyltransferase [Pseudomonadota bacterium]
MVFNKLKIILEMIRFEHTVFALPFAYLGMILACKGFPTVPQFLWITVAMVGARSMAMSVNRLADYRIDKRNPRTATWPLPTGKISFRAVTLFAVVSFIVFLIAVYRLAPLCRSLWPVVIVPMIIYPFTKRFTYFSHFVLGLCLGLAPLGAYVAITNRLPEVPIIILGLAVLSWTAGFDIIYSCQDYAFDTREGLHSIPIALGIEKGLQLTKCLHLLTVFLLFLVGLLVRLNFFYFLGLLLISLFLWYENRIVKPSDLSRVNLSFFTLNGLVSIAILLFTTADILIFKRG